MPQWWELPPLMVEGARVREDAIGGDSLLYGLFTRRSWPDAEVLGRRCAAAHFTMRGLLTYSHALYDLSEDVAPTRPGLVPHWGWRSESVKHSQHPDVAVLARPFRPCPLVIQPLEPASAGLGGRGPLPSQ